MRKNLNNKETNHGQIKSILTSFHFTGDVQHQVLHQIQQ